MGKEWPCEHMTLRKISDNKPPVWCYHEGRFGMIDKWISCPECPAARPAEKKVKKVAPAMLKKTNGDIFISDTLFESLEHAQTRLEWFGYKNCGVSWPAVPDKDGFYTVEE